MQEDSYLLVCNTGYVKTAQTYMGPFKTQKEKLFQLLNYFNC